MQSQQTIQASMKPRWSKKQLALIVLIAVCFGMGAAWINFDQEAEDIVTAMDAKEIFEAKEYGIYMLNARGEPVCVYKFKNSPPRLLKFEDIPPEFIERLLKIEDARFWEHEGVDWYRVLGALKHDLEQLDLEEGASTLTQQYARTAAELTRKKLWARKFVEALAARKIEQRELAAAGGNKLKAKQQILAKYCSLIDLGYRQGGKVHGFEAASKAYFGQELGKLSIAYQSSLIAALKGLRDYGPFGPKAAERRKLIIQTWLQAGLVPEKKEKNRIVKTAEQVANEAIQETVAVIENDGRTNSFPIDQTLRELELLGKTGGNIKITTTFDLGVQEVVQKAIAQKMPAIQARYPGIQVGAVVLNWKTGARLALQGGVKYGEGFDRISNTKVRRQPGSVFKPFVHATGIGSGLTAQSSVNDAPYSKNPDWPENADNHYLGPITLEQALVQSRNGATVNLANQIGFPRVIDFATQAGLENLPAEPMTMIGGGRAGVQPMALASAYTAFPRGGKRVMPFSIESIEGGGYSHSVTEMYSMPPEVAQAITAILVKAAKYGTGSFLYNDYGVKFLLATKTGSSLDGWMVAFAPGGFLMLVYVGYDRPSEHNTKSVFGASTAGQIIAATVKGLENYPDKIAKARYNTLFAGAFEGVADNTQPLAMVTPTPEASPTPTPSTRPRIVATPAP